MIFRQLEGLFPMPFNFVAGITQSMAWTLLAPYIVSCPENNTVLAWQNFPGLNISVCCFRWHVSWLALLTTNHAEQPECFYGRG